MARSGEGAERERGFQRVPNETDRAMIIGRRPESKSEVFSFGTLWVPLNLLDVYLINHDYTRRAAVGD